MVKMSLQEFQQYESLVKAIEMDNIDVAKEIMHEVFGKEDTVVEPVVIGKIKNGSEKLRRPLPENAKIPMKQQNAQPNIVELLPCQACGTKISNHADSCPNCGHPTGIKICPKCGSSKTKVISGISKAASIFLWGPFAANKIVSNFECRSCGHKF